jgi:hypothetical protein
MKNVVFWDTKTQLLPHRKHNISATEPSQLMVCKIWYFYGGDYEECRLLGYKTPFRTSQETHYVFAAKTSRLILSNIWGFHGGDYEECGLLACYTVWLLWEPTFRRNVSPPSSGWKESAARNNVNSNCQYAANLRFWRGVLHCVLPEDCDAHFCYSQTRYLRRWALLLQKRLLVCRIYGDWRSCITPSTTGFRHFVHLPDF